MFNRFTRDARAVAREAEAFAARGGSPTIEAEHLLLALAAGPLDLGLDCDDVREALDAENARSLAAVGVSCGAFHVPPPVAAPRWGTSAKLALERSLRVALARKDRRIEPGHVLLGVLAAPVGTVPRALECAGIDRAALRGRVESALGDPR
jgi:ATP-dependent Clp protease ATP-binding subunit ClpA